MIRSGIVRFIGLVVALILFPAQADSDTILKSDIVDQHFAEKVATSRVSPIRKINHKRNRVNRADFSNKDKKLAKKRYRSKYRSIDGRYNNRKHPDLGATHQPLVRLFDPAYTDGISSLAGAHRASARKISNLVVALNADNQHLPNPYAATDYLWQWGQFLDHDIDLTDGADLAEPANIAVPADDALFIGGSEIPFNRSLYDVDSGKGPAFPRQQLNEITAWIDASNVYGSSEERANALRALDGNGKLKVSEGNLLPFNTKGLPNAGDNGSNSEFLFLAGDVRANEQIGLTVMHTLFVREHNRLATLFKRQHPKWSGEKIYQESRRLVGAMMQAITFNEFLPALLGKNVISPYRGYDRRLDSGISNIFSTAAYRFGHSALSPRLMRVDADGNEHRSGHLPLRNAFFSPYLLQSEADLDPILRGLAAQQCQAVDSYLVEDVRSFLFGDPLAGGFDLAALNIQRGRDHGLPAYNAVRESLGLPVAIRFTDVSSDSRVQDSLRSAYSSPDDIDVWVGGLAEDRLPGSHLGLLFTLLIKEQFEALRDGDRFWYERKLSKREQRFIKRSTLAKIIRRNSGVGRELPPNVFRMKKSKLSD